MNWRKHLAVFVFYCGVAVLITWPLVTQLTTHLYGDFLTDAYQSARHAWWIQHALTHGEPLFFQPTFNYPDGLHGATIWANPLEFFPGWLFAFVMPVNAAMNLMLLLFLALNGWSVYWLVRYLMVNPLPSSPASGGGVGHRMAAPSPSTGRAGVGSAVLAGLIFMTYPAVQSRIYGGQVGVLALWPLPIYVYGLFRLRFEGKLRDYALTAVFFALSIAGSSSLLVFYLMPVTGVFMLVLLYRRAWDWLRRSLMALAGGTALALVLLLPLIIETYTVPQYNTQIGESVRFSADLLSIVSPSFYHPLFDNFDYNRRVLGLNLIEGTGYLGLIALGLALLGLWKRRETRWWLAVALVAWVFSLGPLLKVYDEPVFTSAHAYTSYVTLPWGFLQNLPVLNLSRTPGRFNVTVGLALAVMAGYGASYLWARLPRLRWRVLVSGLLAVLIVFEYQSFWPLPTTQADPPQALRQLAERDDIRAVFNIPWDDRILSKRGLYQQVYHRQNLIAGLLIRDTPVNPAKLNLLQYTLDPALLDAAGADVVIWHRTGDERGQRLAGLTAAQLGLPVYQDADLAIFNVPPADAAPAFTALAEPQQTLTTRSETPVYVPGGGWLTVSGTLSSADGERHLRLYVDDTLYRTLTVGVDDTRFSLPVPLHAAGFYTLRLELAPVCPRFEHPALACRAVTLRDFAVTDFTPDDNHDPVQFERGLWLVDYHLGDVQPGEALPLRLAWRFDELPTDADSRFVHVLDAANNLVAQADGPIPAGERGMSWAEQPEIPIPADLAPGTYRVYTGWYTYPSIERFAVLSDVPGAADGAVLLGTFER